MGKADATARGPVEHRRHHRAGLRHEGHPAFLRRAGGKRCVHLNRRGDDAKAVRADHAQQMRTCRLEHRVLQRNSRGVAAFAETGGDDDGRFRTACAQLRNEGRHGLWRRADDGQIGRERQGLHVGIAKYPGDRVVLRIDRKDRPLETAFPQIFGNHGAYRMRPVACADERNAVGTEKSVEVAGGHRALMAVWAAEIGLEYRTMALRRPPFAPDQGFAPRAGDGWLYVNHGVKDATDRSGDHGFCGRGFRYFFPRSGLCNVAGRHGKEEGRQEALAEWASSHLFRATTPFPVPWRRIFPQSRPVCRAPRRRNECDRRHPFRRPRQNANRIMCASPATRRF